MKAATALQTLTFICALVFGAVGLASESETQVQATRYICTSVDQDTEIQLNMTMGHADSAPRAQFMMIRNLNVSEVRSHIASFDAADGLLSTSESIFAAAVDLRNPKSSHRGKRIGGTVLGSLKSIALEVDFSYQMPTSEGQQFSAQVVYTKTNGEQLQQDFDCLSPASRPLAAL